MSKFGTVRGIDGDTFMFTCAQEETAIRFERACEILGGESWGYTYQGKARGYKVEVVMGGAWVKSLHPNMRS